jgi:hypothetical protein
MRVLSAVLCGRERLLLRNLGGGVALATALILAGSCGPKALLTDEEARLLGSLDAKHALEEIKQFSEVVVSDPSGLGAGTASAGTEQEARLAAFVEEKFRAHGLEVSRITFPVREFHYGPVSVSVAGHELPSVILYGSPGITGVRDGRAYRQGNWKGGEVLRASLVYAGSGTRAEVAAAGDVRGKILLLLRDDGKTGWPSLAALEAAQQGAAGVIFFGVSGEGSLLPDALRQDSLLQQNAIPAFSIRRADGERLREELARRPLEAEIKGHAEERDGRSVNVLGELKGERFPDEMVLVSAHLDRWFTGCQDNASGIGAMLELVRAVAGRGKPSRSILFAAVGSEEAGARNSVDEWLAGSYALVKQRPELFERAALILNLDGAGWKGEKGRVNVSPEGKTFAASLLNALGLASHIEVVPRMSPWVDAWCYSSVGGATTMYSDWMDGFDAYYHTDRDRCEEPLLANLGTDLRVDLLAIERADRADSPPIDFTALSSWVRSAYEEDARRVPDASFVGLRAALAGFEEAVAGEGRRLKAARERGEAALTQFNAERMAVRNALVPALVVPGEYLAETRTYRYSTDAAHLAEILRLLPHADLGEREGRAQLARVIEVMEKADDFQDAAPTPSWSFQFSRRTLERINQMMEKQRSWTLEHDQKQDTVSPEVFDLYEEMHQALEKKTSPWSYDASRAAKTVQDLRAQVLARLEANQAGVIAALEAAARRLKGDPPK